MEMLGWNVKSTSKAREGLYVYDTVQRLNDARFGDRDISDISQYIKLGPMGRSFKSEERVVLLIDEIDKADMEFPNDLLHELDQMSFLIDETGETVTTKHRPVVVVTSNNEKELPDAFLRRCVFHYIAFPEEELMFEDRPRPSPGPRRRAPAPDTGRLLLAARATRGEKATVDLGAHRLDRRVAPRRHHAGVDPGEAPFPRRAAQARKRPRDGALGALAFTGCVTCIRFSGDRFRGDMSIS